MKLGAFLGLFDPSSYGDLAVEAEQLGFESVWIPEHLILPAVMTGRPGAPEQPQPHAHLPATTPLSDCLIALTEIAVRTSRVKIGTCVLVPGLRHPFVTARALQNLDAISGGRLEVGVGAGWLRGEWDATQVPFSGRGRRLEEVIEICRRLWREPAVSHSGEFFQFDEVMFEPKPARAGGIPFHIGGDSLAALDRAARLGDGWMAMSSAPDRIGETVTQLQDKRRGHGRVGSPFEISVSTRDPSTLAAWQKTGVVDRVLVGAIRDISATRKAWQQSADFIRASATTQPESQSQTQSAAQ